MLKENLSLPERRLTATERRAGRKFIAHLMEKFPLLGRLAYPVRGEDAIIYIRMYTPEDQQTTIDELAAALTGLIYEQEKMRVFLIPDDFPIDEPIRNEQELKISQAQLSCDIDCLRKLRKFNDDVAKEQINYYQKRYQIHTKHILDYLNSSHP
ncbi:MAG: hypothetical protein IPK14_12790 [Blastocatellia bacterium]|nr:hypothetical protein [Blastocatellia bacterium]MBL8194892.1 hypothetical protein [Blastocatellia bacterium]MBN8724215.1 hypothetical protein [Acidobacteriota bacterium]